MGGASHAAWENQAKQAKRTAFVWLGHESPPAGWRDPEAHSAELQKQAEDCEAEQAALFEAIPLESQYLATLAVYVEAKQEQVERLEDRLENLIEQQLARLQQSQSRRPGLLAMPSTRAAWQQQQARQQARIQCLQNRLENVREIKEAMDLHGPKIEVLAARVGCAHESRSLPASGIRYASHSATIIRRCSARNKCKTRNNRHALRL